MVQISAKELKRIVEAIEKAKELSKVNDEEIKIDGEFKQRPLLIREQVNNQRANNIPLYKCSQLSQEILGKELHLFPVGKISNWIIEMAYKQKAQSILTKLPEDWPMPQVLSRSRIKNKKLFKICFNSRNKRWTNKV